MGIFRQPKDGEDFTWEDFQAWYSDNPPVGAVSLDDVAALAETLRRRDLPDFELRRQYFLGWDLSPVAPMSKKSFLKRMRGW